MNELKQEIKSRLLEKLDHSMEMEDEAVQELVENEVWLMGKDLNTMKCYNRFLQETLTLLSQKLFQD